MLNSEITSAETGYTPTNLALTSAVGVTNELEWSTKLANIMLVDDEEFNILTVKHHLRDAGYQNFCTTTDPTSALAMMWEKHPDLILLDVMMPVLNGMDLLQLLRNDPKLGETPVIIVTASDDAAVKLQALELGATDFLSKPVDVSELVLRVRNTLLAKEQRDRLKNYNLKLEGEVHKRTLELEASRREVVYCLARAGESRDSQTGWHVTRVSNYAGIIAAQLGFSAADIEQLALAAQLHDVGKIGISDSILLKPGGLDPDEYDLMKRHCEFGVNIIQSGNRGEAASLREHVGLVANFMGECRSPLMQLAALIAATHHEKWDGSGYPLGLAGEDIPIEGRITAVADVFDALTSDRPYKHAFPREKSLAIMARDRGSHFDPDVFDAFLARQEAVQRIMVEFSDEA